MSADLKGFRARLGIKQSDLAKRLDIAQSAVSEWEHGDRTPTYAALKAMLEMGATVEELFGIEYRPKSPVSPEFNSITEAFLMQQKGREWLKNALQQKDMVDMLRQILVEKPTT